VHHFYPSLWPRFLQVSRVVLVLSVMLAIFLLPAHARERNDP